MATAEEKPVVAPGELLTNDASNWVRGQGTYVTGDGGLQASLCGEIHMMNRMVRVEAATSRYVGATGDTVVGRVQAVGAGRWRVDVGAHLDAGLMLQNVNLPGGHLRRKTLEDQRQMRELFREADMLSAEVQKVNRDGSLSLHTRSTRYGKLEGGVLVSVPAVLVKRLSSHFHVFAFGIEALIGVNGYVWLRKASKTKKRKRDDSDSEDESVLRKDILKSKAGDEAEEEEEQQSLTAEDRVNIARLRAAISLLAEVLSCVSRLFPAIPSTHPSLPNRPLLCCQNRSSSKSSRSPSSMSTRHPSTTGSAPPRCSWRSTESTWQRTRQSVRRASRRD